MTDRGGKLTILLDEGAPVTVAAPFSARGHRVIYHSEVLESGASDDEVVVAAMLNKAALVAVDLDMKRLVRRFGSPTHSERYKKLNLIFLSCGDVLASKRIALSMTFIEHEWAFSLEKQPRRMWVDIAPHRLTSYR